MGIATKVYKHHNPEGRPQQEPATKRLESTQPSMPHLVRIANIHVCG